MESILSSIDDSSHHDYQNESNAIVYDDDFMSFSNALRQFVLNSNNNGQEAASSATTTTDAAATTAPSSQQSSSTTANWLYETCSRINTPIPTLQFALEVLSTIQQTTNDNDESKMQSSLFELFGESNIEQLFEVMGNATDIRTNVSEDKLRSIAKGEGGYEEGGGLSATTTRQHLQNQQQQHEHLHQLRSEAYEAANLVVALRTDLLHSQQQLHSYANSSATHSVSRKSDKDATKTYKRTIKQALNAVNNARLAGALTEGDDLFLKSQLSLNDNNNNNNNSNNVMEQMMLRNEEAMLYTTNNTRGLDGMTPQQIQSMKFNLLPEGTKEYNDSTSRGLPRGTEREMKEGYEKVTIPAPIRDKSLLRSRINLDQVLGEGTDERKAFIGTNSLNPMQSTVFDAAYNTRENLLICAPTGEFYEKFLDMMNE